jgi:hypothetical protein
MTFENRIIAFVQEEIELQLNKFKNKAIVIALGHMYQVIDTGLVASAASSHIHMFSML